MYIKLKLKFTLNIKALNINKTIDKLLLYLSK